MPTFQRIVVVGTSGAGKTTIACQIAARLGLPHVELDELHWDANWNEAPLPVFRTRVAQALVKSVDETYWELYSAGTTQPPAHNLTAEE